MNDSIAAATPTPLCTVDCIRFTCPFCQRTCEAHNHGEDDAFMTHVMPGCERFDALEPDEFMYQVNVQHGLHN